MMWIPLLGIGAAALAGLAGYHSMAPQSQLYGAAFTGLPPGSKKLALTYDDGPNDPWTSRLLDVLAKHNVRATMFLLGQYVVEKPQIARQHVEYGNAIGNHSWDHPNLIFAGPGSLRRQLERTSQAIFDATGIQPSLFRPPFGGRRPGVMQLAREMGMTPIMWNVTCYDWKATSPITIQQHADRQIHGGNVILLHDGGHLHLGTDRSHTVAATDYLIRRYQDKGYQFVTIPEMLS